MIRFETEARLNGERRLEGEMERKSNLTCCQISLVAQRLVHMKNEILTTNKLKIYL